MSRFGKWLKGMRHRQGLTQDELARRCGISASYVSRLEHESDRTKNGDPCQPSPKVVEAMAAALRVPVEEARLAAGYSAAEPPTDFGRWLQDRRITRGLTQEELARTCEVTGAYVSLLEQGADKCAHPSVEIVDRLARALGADCEEARAAAGFRPPEAVPLPTHEAELLRRFRELPLSVQMDVEAEVEALHRRHARAQNASRGETALFDPMPLRGPARV